MLAIAWTALGCLWSYILALLCLCLAFPFFLLLKWIGEHLGIALSVFLTPLFYIPKYVRAACVLLLALWAFWAYPLPFWLQILALFQLTTSSAFSYFLADRYRSFEANVAHSVLGIYGLHLCFLQAYNWADSLFLRLLLTSLMFAAPAYLLRSMYRAYTIYEKDQEQRVRDAYARKVDRRIRQGMAVPPFCLYLRGFVLDGLFGPQLPNWAVEGGRFTSGKPIIATDSSKFLETMDDMMMDELESILGRSSRKFGGLIALGHPGEAIGAGRIETEEASWKYTVANLMERATIIFAILVDRPGTIWEIEHLVGKGYLNKTVFVMPRTMAFFIGPRSRPSSFEVSWNSARESLRGILSLPDYRSEGGFFMRDLKGEFVFAPGHWNDRGMMAVSRTHKSLMRLLDVCAGEQERSPE